MSNRNTFIAIDFLHIPDLILKLCIFIPFYIRVISLTTGKMVPGLGKSNGKEYKFEDNFIAN